MIEEQPMNEVTLARECLQRLSDEKSILYSTGHVLDQISKSSVGLGEVLQDYTIQANQQLRDLIRASGNAARGVPGHPDDRGVLQNTYFTLKTVKSVLEMMPVAMQRNKAETIGENRLTRADVSAAAEAFATSADIIRLLASEESGGLLAALVKDGGGSVASSGSGRMAATR